MHDARVCVYNAQDEALIWGHSVCLSLCVHGRFPPGKAAGAWWGKAAEPAPPAKGGRVAAGAPMAKGDLMVRPAPAQTIAVADTGVFSGALFVRLARAYRLHGDAPARLCAANADVADVAHAPSHVTHAWRFLAASADADSVWAAAPTERPAAAREDDAEVVPVPLTPWRDDAILHALVQFYAEQVTIPHTHTHARTHTPKNTHAHTQTRTHMHARILLHIHTHA
jgi:hypothetical protein